MAAHQLQFDGVYDYGALATRLTDSHIPLEVFFRSGSLTTTRVIAKLDTGATCIFAGPALASELGIKLTFENPLVARTAAGSFDYELHPVTLAIPSWPVEIEVDVAFANWSPDTAAGRRVVLGLSGFFNRFIVAIDEPHQRLWWKRLDSQT